MKAPARNISNSEMANAEQCAMIGARFPSTSNSADVFIQCGQARDKHVRLYRQKTSKGKSRFWSFDVTIGGQRYRGKTGETNQKRAERIAAKEMERIEADGDPLTRKRPTLRELSIKFLEHVDAMQRA